ncbi:MAG TPA: sigma-54 dependent transcriptional regulator [Gemmatimonadales bacterium]|nr:sigma-54 dependent transcriptional regulator [Gemmatimonadales bacterium]
MMRLLIVDDDPGLRKSLALLLSAEGYDVAGEGDAARALERLQAESFDLVLCDVRMPGIDGIEFLRRYRADGGSALIIVMSAYGGDDQALAAMKEGAYDYISKPFRAEEVLLTLRKAEERERLRGRVAALEAEVARWRDRDVVAESPAMRRMLDLAARVAAHSTTVLITGESGTGKEVLARAIHRMSARREGPFVAVNCGAIPENLLESELFGYVRGAFTGATADHAGLFEEAEGGTILLDEIGDLPAALQVKLLRVLQEGEIRRVGDRATRQVDARVLAATARDLEADLETGRFREDLYYRLNVVRLHIPPLRDRPEDIAPLAAALLARAGQRAGRPLSLTPGALAALKRRTWAGNVRELENAIERAAVLSPDGVIAAENVAANGATPERAPAPAPDHNGSAPVALKDAVRAAERAAVQRALGAAGGNRGEAAQLLGVSLRTLYYKLRDLAE